MDEIRIQDVEQTELSQAIGLVRAVFDRFVAPDYTPDGGRAFAAYTYVGDVRKRLAENCFMLVAKVAGEMAGVMEVRDYSHVCLLFTAEAFQGRGVAGSLLREALTRCRKENPGLTSVTVNSSPYAVKVYEKLGFSVASPEIEKDGIRFTPMVMTL